MQLNRTIWKRNENQTRSIPKQTNRKKTNRNTTRQLLRWVYNTTSPPTQLDDQITYKFETSRIPTNDKQTKQPLQTLPPTTTNINRNRL